MFAAIGVPDIASSLSPVAFADASGDAVIGEAVELIVVPASADRAVDPIRKSPMMWLAGLLTS
jgi:hypothetical protein